MLVLKNGLVCTMVGEPKVMDVAVENGKIAAVGENLPETGAAQIIDAGGKLIIISTADGIGTDYHRFWQSARANTSPVVHIAGGM